MPVKDRTGDSLGLKGHQKTSERRPRSQANPVLDQILRNIRFANAGKGDGTTLLNPRTEKLFDETVRRDMNRIREQVCGWKCRGEPINFLVSVKKERRTVERFRKQLRRDQLAETIGWPGTSNEIPPWAEIQSSLCSTEATSPAGSRSFEC